MPGYNDYIEEQTAAVKNCLRDLGCQPVVFLGSGLAQRYSGGPSWRGLLADAIAQNPLVTDEFAYLLQSCGSLAGVGEALVDPFHKYAWSTKGDGIFPDALFVETTPKDCYLKYAISKIIETRVPGLAADLPAALRAEIELLKGIRPNSIITTNFDTLSENIFSEYTPVIGQTIIRAASMMIGEVFKIHGCITEPSSLIVTSSDYENWTEKKKYLSAKLLTFFLEHPVLIVGYSAQDENVIAILRDIDEILASKGELVGNIFYVVHDPTITADSNPAREAVLDLKNGNSMRVNCIHAEDLSWVYRAFAASEGVENVNPKLLRALMARTYELVRHDIPKMTMEINYGTLEQAISADDALPKLLGITSLSDPDTFNAVYPYITTGIATKLGFKTWHGARQLINQIKQDKGVDISASDNQFHISVRSGTNSFVHKYSEAAVDLLSKVLQGVDYNVALKKKETKKKPAPKLPVH